MVTLIDRENGAGNAECGEGCTFPNETPCNTTEVAQSTCPLVGDTSESDRPAVTLGARSGSEVLETEQQQPSVRPTRLVSIDTIEACTSSAMMESDCCDMDIPMNISTETEEANDSTDGDGAV